MGHIEVVAATINGLLTGATDRKEVQDAPLASLAGIGNAHHFLNTGQTALVANSLVASWQGDFVFNTGDFVLGMLHNFLLECGARMGKLRVYEITDNPIARAMCGYLLVRGGVHQLAYARTLETLTGVDVSKMLNIPNISNETIPEAKQFKDQGVHRILYRFSPDDYQDIDKIWKGKHPEDGSDLQVVNGPPAGGPVNPLAEEPQVFASGYHLGELAEIAKRMMSSA